jgi:aspartate/tyrosine/aromatic aminotransferase
MEIHPDRDGILQQWQTVLHKMQKNRISTLYDIAYWQYTINGTTPYCQANDNRV